MDNLLSGALGALIGTAIASLISYKIFVKQVRIDSNRCFLLNILETLRKIFVLLERGIPVPEDHIHELISFSAISLNDFKLIESKITSLVEQVIQYNDGVKQTVASTSTTSLQMTARDTAKKNIREIVGCVRTLT